MGGMLGSLAGFREEPEQTTGIGRRFDLSQADVSGNDGENVVEIVRDPAGEGAERFELAGGEPFGFRFLALADVAEENRDAAIAPISVDIVPNLTGRIGGFEFDRDPFGHDAFVVRLENRANECWELFPKNAAKYVSAFTSQHLFRFGVEVGHLPFGIDREKSVRR